jgi:hypothetical protein
LLIIVSLGENQFDDENDLPDIHIENIEILARGLQIHHSQKENRLYLQNLESLFPSDLPRQMNSTDLYIRILRPEFIQRYSQPLSPLAYMDLELTSLNDFNDNPFENEFNDDLFAFSGKKSFLFTKENRKNSRNFDSNTTKVHFDDTMTSQSGDPSRLSDLFRGIHEGIDTVAIASSFGAIEFYNVQYLPKIAKELDSLVTVPIDSFTLTQFLHSRGINCRSIGMLLDFSSVPAV